MITTEMLQNVRGGDVLDSDGERIGAIGEIYLDDHTGQPAWVTVNTGLFGTSESFVPLEDADMAGDDIRVPYPVAMVKDAPRMDAGHHLDADQERELYRYYGVRYEGAPAQADSAAFMSTSAGADADTAAGTVSRGEVAPGPGYEGSAQESLVLREERLRIGTERVQTGRARLRRYVVGEDQTVAVPVSRESVVIERRPLPEGGVVDVDLARAQEREIEVVLTEERPLVSRETVAVEEVGLRTHSETGSAQVTETVRHEEVELERSEGGLRLDDLRD